MESPTMTAAAITNGLPVPKPHEYPVWVCVKVTERRYGGPEEGGWYYDASVAHYCLERCRTIDDYTSNAVRLCKAFELRVDPTGERFPSRWDSRECADKRLMFSRNRPQDRDNPRPRYE